MDLVVDLIDNNLPFVDQFYQSNFGWDRTNDYRRYWTLMFILVFGGYALYFFFAGFSWLFLFPKEHRKHKLFIKNQEWLEMKLAAWSIPIMAIFAGPCFWAEGYSSYSKVYHADFELSLMGAIKTIFIIIWFLFITDFGVYVIHRGLHLDFLYFLHKPHHRWLVTTPFASHAFHPIDGFAQSLPYHIYTFIFPIEAKLYLFLFLFVNFWTISIHDGVVINKGTIINGAEHHNVHHRLFNYNYGQYFTLWDRLGGTHKLVDPDEKADSKDKTE